MDSSEEEEIALLSVILFDNKRRRKQAKKRRFWVREIFQRREEHGVFSNLVTELQLGDREYYFKYELILHKLLFCGIFLGIFLRTPLGSRV